MRLPPRGLSASSRGLVLLSAFITRRTCSPTCSRGSPPHPPPTLRVLPRPLRRPAPATGLRTPLPSRALRRLCGVQSSKGGTGPCTTGPLPAPPPRFTTRPRPAHGATRRSVRCAASPRPLARASVSACTHGPASPAARAPKFRHVPALPAVLYGGSARLLAHPRS